MCIQLTYWTLQDPLVTKGSNLYPLLGIDVWEHAYYLQVISFSNCHVGDVVILLFLEYASYNHI